MTAARQTICLCIVVKNQAAAIPRCVAAVRPIIDHFIVLDVGSTDGTQKAVWTALAGLPGMLIERHGTAVEHRDEALALARPLAAYTLILDAGDELLIPPGFAMPRLDADFYTFGDAVLPDAPCRSLVSNALAWRYAVATDVAPTCAEARSAGHLPIAFSRDRDQPRRDPSTSGADAAILPAAPASRPSDVPNAQSNKTMTAERRTVCLCMIVKDEAAVIQRCLASVRPILDHWIIVDTGSTDGTQEIIRAAMRTLPGELIERPWVDFAHNRTEALAYARPRADYSFIIDADDDLDIPAGFAMPDLAADSYTIDIHYNAIIYRRPQFVRNTLEWRYRGVLHEFLEAPGAGPSGHLPIIMRINHEGRRSTDPTTYAKDAAILERALATETDPFLIARYTFYLAQSYRDCGNQQAALAAYLRRSTLGFWAEEVFHSLYQAGGLMQALGHPPDDIIATYQRATDACPTRAEAAHAASRYCRHLSRFQQGFDIGNAAIALAAPTAPSGLFIEAWIYEYGLCDEVAVNAYWAGRDRACLDASLRALESGKVPAHEQPRFLQNMRFALDRMAAEPPPPSATATAIPDVRVEQPVQDPPPTAAIPTQINLGSGKDFRDDFFNIDINDSWHPDAVLDLSAIDLDATGVAVRTARFGAVVLKPSTFEIIMANDVLEHVVNLVSLMTTCLALLRIGGVFKISVPYDLSFGAWQDPTHVRTFNEGSWLYYSDWFWYFGWSEARFVVDMMDHVASPLGLALRQAGVPEEEVRRTPRAIDAMSVHLRKVELTADDRATFARWRPQPRRVAAAQVAPPAQNAGSSASVAAAQAAPALSGSWSENKDRYCIWVATRDKYSHHLAFREAAEGLSSAFAALGGSAPLIGDLAECADRQPIVFGSHLLSEPQRAKLPQGATLFNLEQIGSNSPWVQKPYLDLLAQHPLLDYSHANVAVLRASGLGHVRHLPIRPMPELARIQHADMRDIDVLFYGSVNERRASVLNGLRARGLNAVELFDVYGGDRDAAIARSKIVANIHFYDTAIFEAVRVSHLLANGVCVVSEGRADDPDAVDLANGLIFCSLDEFVETCVGLVADEERCRSMEARARETAILCSQANVLRAAFGL